MEKQCKQIIKNKWAKYIPVKKLLNEISRRAFLFSLKSTRENIKEAFRESPGLFKFFATSAFC